MVSKSCGVVFAFLLAEQSSWKFSKFIAQINISLIKSNYNSMEMFFYYRIIKVEFSYFEHPIFFRLLWIFRIFPPTWGYEDAIETQLSSIRMDLWICFVAISIRWSHKKKGRKLEGEEIWSKIEANIQLNNRGIQHRCDYDAFVL